MKRSKEARIEEGESNTDEVEETVPQVRVPGVGSLVNKYISKGT